MYPNRTITPSPSVIVQELEGEAVLLDQANFMFYALDATGARIWTLLQEHGTAHGVIEQMLREFAVDRERVEADLDKLLHDLAQHALITLESHKQ